MLRSSAIKVMLFSLLVVMLGVLPATATAGVVKGYKEINASNLKTMMESGDPLVVFPLSSIEFKDLHIAGSINIPLHKLKDELPADKNRPLVFYCLGVKCTASWRAAEKAVKLGFKDVYAFRTGLPAWVEAGYPTVSKSKLPEVDINKITTDQLFSMIAADKDVILLDICLTRDAEKFWIESSQRIHIPLDDLEARIDEIPKGKKIAVICLKGKRSPTAIRFLTAKGFKNLYQVKGGMQQWILEGKPVKTS